MPYADPDRQRQAARDWKRKNVLWFREFKKTLKCETCGFNHPAALHFHHANGDKRRGVALIAVSGASPERIMEEVAKCQVLCANCHAILHDKEMELARSGKAVMKTCPRGDREVRTKLRS